MSDSPVYSGRSKRGMTVPGFIKAKKDGRKLSVLTAYDYLWAEILDEAGVDAILVGDSLSMVVQGNSTTLPVTLDEMIYHAKIVARGIKKALLIVDMPFLSFQVSPENAIANAGRILKETEAAAVKLEGGVSQAKTIQALTSVEIPVMAHVGMRPQSVRSLGSMGRIQRDEKQLLEDAKAAEDAGAFGIVLELIPRSIAKKITESISIPTIGIGAGPDCDGQVLVTQDMLGLNGEFHPKFLKKYAQLRETVTKATQSYISEVQNGVFPAEENSHD